MVNRELAAAYQSMRESYAFRHLMTELDEIMKASVADEDRVSTEDLTVQVIAECRGVRKGLNQLIRRVDEIASYTE